MEVPLPRKLNRFARTLLNFQSSHRGVSSISRNPSTAQTHFELDQLLHRVGHRVGRREWTHHYPRRERPAFRLDCRPCLWAKKKWVSDRCFVGMGSNHMGGRLTPRAARVGEDEVVHERLLLLVVFVLHLLLDLLWRCEAVRPHVPPQSTSIKRRRTIAAISCVCILALRPPGESGSATRLAQ